MLVTGVSLILILLGFFYFKNKKNNDVEQTQTLTDVVKKQDLTQTVQISGSVLSANYIEIKTQAIGTVAEIFVKDGEMVKEGDKLFELELSTNGKELYQSAYSSYLAAKNNLASAQNKLNSLQVALFEKNKYFIEHAVAENLVEDDPDYIMQKAAWLAAENDYKNQSTSISQVQAQVNSAWQTYLNTSAVITAPATGKIENITAVIGRTFGDANNNSSSGNSLSDRLGTIKISEKILVNFNVSTIDIEKVMLGQKVVIIYNDMTLEGKVVSIDRFGDEDDTTTYPVIAEFSAQEGVNLWPNLTVEGEILISEIKEALVVPTLAIEKKGNKEIVNVRDSSNQVSSKEITTGIVAGNLTQVLSGVSEGEIVVFTLPEYSVNQNNNMRMMMGGGEMGGGGGMPPDQRSR